MEDTDDLPLWQHCGNTPVTNSEPLLGKDLSLVQRLTLKEMLTQYSEVIQDTPGKTIWIEHTIMTTNSSPVRLAPYHLPYAYRVDGKSGN